jgi:transcriptional regulator with XRE-family HTH domain
MHKVAGPTYDIARIRRDMVSRGWLPIDLARAADASHMTIGRFLSGERQTPRTLKKIADAFGYDPNRYVVVVPDGGATTDDDSQLALPLPQERRAVGR